jgi:hypothetical protein
VGVTGSGAARENNADQNNAYCVYAGASAGSGAALRTDIPGPYAGIAIWKGKLVFDIWIPTTDKARDQLIALAGLVLQRAQGLTE